MLLNSKNQILACNLNKLNRLNKELLQLDINDDEKNNNKGSK